MPFSMKIGEAGEAFFVFETDSDVPDDLITSPLLEPTLPVSPNPLPEEDFGRFGTRHLRGDLIEDGLGQEPDFLDLNAASTLQHGEISETSVFQLITWLSWLIFSPHGKFIWHLKHKECGCLRRSRKRGFSEGTRPYHGFPPDWAVGNKP